MLEPYRTETSCLKVDARSPEPAIIKAAAACIRRGGLVAFPTETVYGLGANAFAVGAVDKIFRAKGRPANDPLIIHIAELEQLRGIAIEIPVVADQLCHAFMPGALTLVLKKQPRIPANLTAGLDTVAVRMPDHAVALALIRESGLPIAAPSANRFSRPSPTCAQHVLDDLEGHVDVILDGGSTAIGLESTIVSLVADTPQLLRPGATSLESLRAIVPDIVYQPRYLCENGGNTWEAPAPGTMLKHYSPRATVLVFTGEDDEAVYAAMRRKIAQHHNVGILALEAEAAEFAGQDITIASLGATLDDAALLLFAAMRTLDKQGVEQILVRSPKPSGLGLAIGDRLLRAAAGQVIDVKPER